MQKTLVAALLLLGPGTAAQAQYYNPIPMPDGSPQFYTRPDGMIDYGRPIVIAPYALYHPLRDSPANDGFRFNPNMVPVKPPPPMPNFQIPRFE